MAVFAGQGDADPSMALLWRGAGTGSARPGAPGPKPGLSVDLIVHAAIEVADEEGMAALSMRAVGERLGRTAMALYTYVPTKSVLVDLMYDQAFGELSDDDDREAGWRAAVTAWANRLWEFYLRHPWTLQVSQARPVLGPNEFTVLETVIRILRDTGLPSRTLRPLVGALFHFVRGAVQTTAEARRAATATGAPDEQWWSARAALLGKVAPDFAERFPLTIWLHSDGPSGSEAGDGPFLEQQSRAVFDRGLAAFLDGVEVAAAAGRS